MAARAALLCAGAWCAVACLAAAADAWADFAITRAVVAAELGRYP